MRILVTGAGGFIGRAAVAALRAAGHEVRAGQRRGGGMLCDLDAPATLIAALAGVEGVVHCAYGDVAAMPAQTEALLSAMSDAGARRLVALSSIAVYGDAEGLIEEQAPLSARDPYGVAKIACETAIRRWSAGEAVILRPGIVYGAGSRFWIDKIAERIRAGAWGDLGPYGEGFAALIHVEDLAAMIARLVANPSCARAALHAVGPETPSWNAYFAALAEALGAPPLPRWSGDVIARRRRLALPAKVWRRFGLPGGRALALAPTGGELKLFARRARYATAAAGSLGLSPQIGLAEGLRRSRLGAP